MKKSTLSILIASFVVVFATLIVLQIVYMKNLIAAQTVEFDRSIHRALTQTCYLLEQDETRRYLENELEEDERNIFANQTIIRFSTLMPTTHFLPEDTLYAEGDSANLSLKADTSISQPLTNVFSITQYHQYYPTFSSPNDLPTVLRERYLHQKDLLEDVIFRILYEANNLPIAQRVDFRKLEMNLARELDRNGLGDIPFHFKILDKDGKEVYCCNDFYIVGDAKADYIQSLFLNDPGSRHASLCLYIPDRKDYIRHPVIMFIPIITFSIMLLLAFAVGMFLTLKQRHLAEMKTDFINNMTHELKTPVSTISLASQMLSDSDVSKDPANIQRISTVIRDESKRLSFLVEKVLQMSIFEREKKSTLSFSEIELHTIIESVVSSFRLKVASYNGTIETDLQAPDSLVLADQMHITNVIFNLLDNAVKYRDESRPLHLRISTRKEEGLLVLEISDNGIGIQRENLKKIFDRFYRVSTGNVHNVKGFGLGLAYVHNIILRHNGSITAESEYGQGSTFIIHLPLINNEL